MLYTTRILTTLLLLCSIHVFPQTIAEKRRAVERRGMAPIETSGEIALINRELVEAQDRLRTLFAQAADLMEENASPEEYQLLYQEIQGARGELRRLQIQVRELSTDNQMDQYALWQQPDATVEQLIIDYGSHDYIYVIPPAIGQAKISIASHLQVPRALWSDLLEVILNQYGIGIRKLNPLVRQLYALQETPGGLQIITSDRSDLELVSSTARVGFFVAPKPAEARRVAFFLERFINPTTTSLHMVGRDILVVSSAAEVAELLKLYDFVASGRSDMEYRLIPLRKVHPEEMTSILHSMFEQFAVEQQAYETAVSTEGKSEILSATSTQGYGGLRVVPLSSVARAVFVVGTREEIERAERIVCEVETCIVSARQRVLYTYRAKHSDPEDLAQILASIYNLMLLEYLEPLREADPCCNGSDNDSANQITVVTQENRKTPESIYSSPFPTTVDDSPGFYQAGAVAIDPAPVTLPRAEIRPVNVGRSNFIVDPKTSNIVMVLEPDLVTRMKELILRLDIPKKMVQLDVLLFEKVAKNSLDYGLNLLNLGGCASNETCKCISWNGVNKSKDICSDMICPAAKGILQFFFSRARGGGLPAYDFAYRFLMSQEDICINANPSVTTLNQTPASIAILEELSISTGVVQVSTGGTGQGSVEAKDAFTRAQYGTKIVITPTIHSRMGEPEMLWGDEPDYVTLITQVNFDTISPSADDRPNVTRREIKNVIRVPDGKTVILGGLRRKNSRDVKDSIPYLGEIPGIGKLFSNSSTRDDETEMFIFITPRIIYDPCEGLEQVKIEQMMRRPGDIPDFLCSLDRARRCEREKQFELGMQMLFGRKPNRCLPWGSDSCYRGANSNWYDGPTGEQREGRIYQRGGSCGQCIQ